MNYATLLKTLFKKGGQLFFAGILLTTAVHAQEFVDTTPQNRNVVLEEFTGLNCTWCPAGHKIADDLKSNNPESVVLVNIHAGGFAIPSEGQPDFRTDYGEAIDNLMGVSSYPSATINRSAYNGDKAISRGSWENAANEILNQSSPVNVAIQTDFDTETQELEVKVEAYYTDSSESNTNRLNVALLQNNIPGPQVDGANSYPDNYFSNGEYNHKHMLRDFLTGQWGDTIQNPHKGSLFTKTYTYKIPEKIGDVKVKPQFLQVAAYVTEGKENVYTGVSEKVNLEDQYLTDLSITQNTEAPKDICASTISPSIEIANVGSKTVNSFDINYQINDEIHTTSTGGALESGDTIQITSSYSLPGGNYNVQFAGISNINDGSLYDKNIENNLLEGFSGYSFLDGAFIGQLSGSFDGSVPDHFTLDASENPTVQLPYEPDSKLGAVETDGAIAQILDARVNGTDQPGRVLFGKVDLSYEPTPQMAFYYAYSKGDRTVTQAPEIQIEASQDCGATWDSVKTITAQETASFTPSQQQPYFLPTEIGNYTKERFSLADYAWQDNLIFRININPGDDGNIIWLDEIQVGPKDLLVGMEETNIASQISSYPNPVSDHITFNFEFDQEREVGIEIVTAQGKTVKAIQPQTFSQGSSEFEINTSALTAGIYIAKLNVEGNMETIQFIVSD